MMSDIERKRAALAKRAALTKMIEHCFVNEGDETDPLPFDNLGWSDERREVWWNTDCCYDLEGLVAFQQAIEADEITIEPDSGTDINGDDCYALHIKYYGCTFPWER